MVVKKKAEETNPFLADAKVVVPTPVNEEVSKSFIEYSMSVVYSRALPDAIDGLKPVARRILFSMFKDGYTPDKNFVKSARTVGTVMATLHPHGDSSIYDAMVKLAQPFYQRCRLVEGYGNWGDAGGASAAASRYCVVGDTHVRLANGTSVRIDSLVNSPSDSERDIDVDVLDWHGNSVKAVKGFNSGTHEIKRVTLANGQSIAGSHNHPLLTIEVNSFGEPVFTWKMLDELHVDDFVCIYRGDDTSSIVEEEHSKLGILAGAWVAEGWFTEKRAGFNNTDKEYFDLVLDAFDTLVDSNVKRYVGETKLKSGKTCYSIDVQNSPNGLPLLRENILGELSGLRSAEKRIPEFIWNSSKEVKRSFLSSIFEGDGSVRLNVDSRHGGLGAKISYVSKSPQLIRDIQELLLEFGIVSRARFTNTRGKSENYLSISSFNQVQKFIEQIDFLAAKKEITQLVLAAISAKESTRMTGDFTPFVSTYVRDLPLDGISGNEKTQITKNNFDRVERWDLDKLKFTELFNKVDPKGIAVEVLDRAYAYSKVVSVVDEEAQEVYSIKVDSKDHSFLAGGFINHNTESRLDKTALLLLSEIRENTVNMRPNYDGEDEEPVVLPVQFPNLVVNGSFGIAVGFASNMAPHNPTEVIDATRWLLTHPNADLEKIMTFIPGPDFPTGGQIIGQDAIKEAYTTGKGIIRIRATHNIEPTGRGKNNIVFTEMPYGVKTEKIIEKVKEGIKSGKLQGIVDIKDLTDRRNGVRLVVETKAGVNPQALLFDLFKQTPLEDSFGINNVALVKGEPKTLGLKEQLEIFIAHRIEVVTRRTQFRKDKRETRLHLIEGMLKALANIDEVIRIIRASADSTVAKTKLIAKFKLDDIQAENILSISLRRLTKFDSIELGNEKKKLLEELKGLNSILSDEKVLRTLIGSELEVVRKQLDMPRRSVLVGGSLAEYVEASKVSTANMSLEVADEACGVFLSAKGGIVRTPKLTSSKPVLSSMTTTTRGKFIALTNKGRAFRIDTIHVGLKEAAVTSVLPEKLASGEKVIAVTPVELAEGKIGGIAIGTRKGAVKIATPTWPVRSDDFTVIGLDNDDEIVTARWVEDIENYEFVFISDDTSLLTFPADKVRPSGLSGAGIVGIKLAEGAKVSSFSVISKSEKATALVITHTGKSIKATPFALYPGKGRATGGVRSHKFLKGETELASSTVAGNGILFTAEGKEVPLPKIDNRRDGSGVAVKADELF